MSVCMCVHQYARAFKNKTQEPKVRFCHKLSLWLIFVSAWNWNKSKVIKCKVIVKFAIITKLQFWNLFLCILFFKFGSRKRDATIKFFSAMALILLKAFKLSYISFLSVEVIKFLQNIYKYNHISYLKLLYDFWKILALLLEQSQDFKALPTGLSWCGQPIYD